MGLALHFTREFEKQDITVMFLDKSNQPLHRKCWRRNTTSSEGTAGLDPKCMHTQNQFPEKKNERVTSIPRPLMESSWRGESKSALAIFVKFSFDLFFQNDFPNIVQKK